MKVLLNLNQAVVLHRIDPLKFDQNPIALETPSLAAATPTVTPVEIAGTIMTHAVRAMIEMILAGKKLVSGGGGWSAALKTLETSSIHRSSQNSISSTHSSSSSSSNRSDGTSRSSSYSSHRHSPTRQNRDSDPKSTSLLTSTDSGSQPRWGSSLTRKGDGEWEMTPVVRPSGMPAAGLNSEEPGVSKASTLRYGSGTTTTSSLSYNARSTTMTATVTKASSSSSSSSN
eukprot:CAMPEP_0175065900 /NCGR_PEP_ID=MMETSP0052_2-20121109/16200_1 /TAXON_ID=51329 ORGANISM="Polytomella parva, Strain SAG 63-3" /NCGR_SAMPLE_ID=MMETSP0052_2 /ASSEMBLY_ACC=CAM_ASM_000194 /LENGTH=228 /DNA_ID=CAMNT_0016332523 /DNA_START=260 /DNA_END=943 /DNA_ORIENTATION=+